MNFQDLIAHILGFCMMVADFPNTLFKSQTTTPISQHLPPLEISNYDQADSSTISTTTATIYSTSPICAPASVPTVDPSMNNCNGPNNRMEWCYGYDITTDYEEAKNFPVTGVTRYYTLVVSDGLDYCGDGYAVSSLLINGTYPGPLIEGNWGDWFEITVINNLSNYNGTSIHWHGLRQWNTVFEDGVGGVTQCPIPPRLSNFLLDKAPANYSNQQIYKFQATQYGASWYHSHFSLQYPDGILGPLVIHGPTSANYDEDLGPLLITDWYHQDAFSLYWGEESTSGTNQTTPLSRLVNGIGNFTIFNDSNKKATPGCIPGDGDPQCVPGHAGHYNISSIKFGKTYRIRIINTSANTHFRFWIDGHDITVIATDFVPIEPWTTNILNVAIGQRYDIIFNATADLSKGESFWINMRDCQSLCITDPLPDCPPSKKSCSYEECRQGIISYSNTSSTTDADKNLGPLSRDNDLLCLDIPMDEIHPKVTRTVTGIPEPFKLDDYFKVSLDSDPNVPSLVHWSLLDEGTSFKINWTNPALILMESSVSPPMPSSYAPIQIDNGGNPFSWHIFVIEAKWDENRHRLPGPPPPTPGNPNPPNPQLTQIPAAHPIHLHGHDFVVLMQSNETFDPDVAYPLATDNPIRRDVAMLPKNGFLILAFRKDNPGPWLMHCHIAWHASNGLALQFIENADEIPKILQNPDFPGIVDDLSTRCDNWNWWYSKGLALQEDSGI